MPLSEPDAGADESDAVSRQNSPRRSKPANTKLAAPQAITAEQHLAAIAHAGRRTDAEILVRMMQDISGHPPRLWGGGIIGFDQYHYQYDSGREGDAGVLGFAARSTGLVVYLVDGTAAHQEALSQLGKHRTSKACVYINKLDDIDLGVLRDVLAASYQSVKARFPGA